MEVMEIYIFSTKTKYYVVIKDIINKNIIIVF